MADDILAEIYNDFVMARAERDVAMESLGDAISALKAAHSKYNAAVSALAEYLGAIDDSGYLGDVGDPFHLQGAIGLKSITNLFGDLF